MQIRPANAPDPEAGITLIEIVVALAIVGVMSSIAVLSIGNADRGAGPETEARRLAARLASAADRALLEGKIAAVSWDERGYSFVDPNLTGEIASDPDARHELQSGLTLAGPSPRGSLAIADDADPGLASFFVSGRDAQWRVDFNGLNASATRMPAP